MLECFLLFGNLLFDGYRFHSRIIEQIEDHDSDIKIANIMKNEFRKFQINVYSLVTFVVYRKLVRPYWVNNSFEDHFKHLQGKYDDNAYEYL